MDLIAVGAEVEREDKIDNFINTFNRKTNNFFFSSALAKYYKGLDMITLVIQPLLKTQRILIFISCLNLILYFFFGYKFFIWFIFLFAFISFFYSDLFIYILMRIGLRRIGITRVKRLPRAEIIRRLTYGRV